MDLSSVFRKSILLYWRLSYYCSVLMVVDLGFISFQTLCLMSTLGSMIQVKLEGSSFSLMRLLIISALNLWIIWSFVMRYSLGSTSYVMSLFPIFSKSWMW